MPEKTDRLYQYLVDEEDARVCSEISENACQVVPGNFFLILFSQCLTKLGDALASAKVVLPWLMNSVGAPVFLSGLLVPIRESGSLLPQLFVGGVIRRFAIRQSFFVVGSLLQCAAVAGMAWVSLSLTGLTAGLTIIGLLIFFSLARGICSIASKDVLGKTVPKSRRGRLTGYSASIAGLISIGVGVSLTVLSALKDNYFLLLLLGAACWLIAAFSYSRIREYAGETQGGGNAWLKAWQSLSILKKDRVFRHFVIVRCLMMSSGLVTPYFIILAQQTSQDSALVNLGIFIIIGGLASFISGNVWGRAADKSSRNVLFITAICTSSLCVIGGFIAYFHPTGEVWALMLLFFLISVVHQGVRLGRKTYLVDLGEGNRRTDYVAVSNTLIGIMLLLAGMSGAVVAQFSLVAVLNCLALASAVAAIMARQLPEAE